MDPHLILFLLTLIPTLELRASIPYGMLFTDLPLLSVLIIAVCSNIILGLLLYYALGKVVVWFRRFRWFDNLFNRVVERPRQRIEKAVDRWGEFGIALFIGIPLPGSGVYTAALGAYLLGVSPKKFFIATIVGVLIAATAVTIIVMTGDSVHSLFVKEVTI